MATIDSKRDVTFDEFFDGLATAALQVAPFEAAAVGRVDRETGQFTGKGAAGGFDPARIRQVGSIPQDAQLSSQPPLLQAAGLSLLAPVTGRQPGTGPLGAILSLGGLRALRLEDVPREEKEGKVRTFDLYVEGFEIRDFLALLLQCSEIVYSKYAWMLVFNNLREGPSATKWAADAVNICVFRLEVERISALLSEYSKNPQTLYEALQRARRLPVPPSSCLLPSADQARAEDTNSVLLPRPARPREAQRARVLHRRTWIAAMFVSLASAILMFVAGAALSCFVWGHAIGGIRPPVLLGLAVVSTGFCAELILGLIWLRSVAKARIEAEEPRGARE